MTNVDELERLAREATPGPWRVHPDFHDCKDDQHGHLMEHPVCIDADPEPVIHDVYYDGHHLIVKPCDSRFIAAANPATVLELVETTRQLRAALREALTLYRNAVETFDPEADEAHDRLLAALEGIEL